MQWIQIIEKSVISPVRHINGEACRFVGFWSCGIITAITEVQQLPATDRWRPRLLFQWNHVSREDPSYTSLADDDDSPTWRDKWSLAVWVCEYWCTTSSVLALLYTYNVSELISLQSVCLAMLCLGQKPDPRHQSQAQEEIEQINPCCPSVRLDGADLCVAFQRKVDDVSWLLLCGWLFI